MKKIFYLSLAVFALASCSSNNDDATQDNSEPKLVEATFKAGMASGESTKAYLGEVDNGTETHLWQDNDQIYLYDYTGKHLFTCTSGGQTGEFHGYWGEVKSDDRGLIAVYPADALTSTGITTDGGYPVMHFTLPTTQESSTYTTSSGTTYVSYDTRANNGAGLAFSINSKKGNELHFAPLVSYLYFYSKNPNCVVKCSDTNNPIAGTYTVKYTGGVTGSTGEGGTDYSTAANINKCCTYTATANTINCTGKYIEGHKNAFNQDFGTAYEYIVCIKPGTYSAGTIQITAGTTAGTSASQYFSNKGEFTAVLSNLYYLGCIDK